MWGRNFGAVTNMVKADVHKHWLIQLFISNGGDLEINVNDQKIRCGAIVVNKNTKHMFYSGNQIHLTMLINPTSQLGRSMRAHFIDERPYYILCEDKAVELQTQLTSAISKGENADYSEIIRNVVHSFNDDNLKGYDERTETILRRIDTCTCEEEEHKVKQIAKEMALSESRLSHHFKEETGIPLKSYIVLHKLLKAYEKIFDGESITAGAIAAGFNSAAHLAFTNKKVTGMPAGMMMKESRFLKVIL